MDELTYVWTDVSNTVFQNFYLKTEEYYSKIVGGKNKREAFVPYNLSQSISDVLIVYDGDLAVFSLCCFFLCCFVCVCFF